jgi:hypothetical protein
MPNPIFENMLLHYEIRTKDDHTNEKIAEF